MLRTRCWISGVGVMLLLAGTTTSVARAGGVPWRHSYDRAVRESRRTGRPMLLNIGGRQCPWCRRLEATTLTDPDIERLLSRHFIPVQIYGEDDMDLVRELDVRSYPTLFMVSPRGRILDVQEGYVNADPLLDRLQRVLDDVEADDHDG